MHPNGPRTMVGQILVYLDGTPVGEACLGYASTVARATGASLCLMTVVESAPDAHPRPVDALGAEIARTQASRYLDAVASRLAATDPLGAEIRTEAAAGRSAEQILQIADRDDVDLIVLTSNGAPDAGRFRMSATVQKVVQHARQSLLMVHADPEQGVPPRAQLERVLVLLDGSIAAESSLPSALELARTLGSEVVLVHALVRAVLPTCEPPTRGDLDLLSKLAERSRELGRAYLRNIERSLRSEGVYCRAILKECDSIRQGVLAVADEEDADLILMTSHGHTSSEVVVHGGVTQQLLMHAKRPIWVVQNLHVSGLHRGAPVASEYIRPHMSGPF